MKFITTITTVIVTGLLSSLITYAICKCRMTANEKDNKYLRNAVKVKEAHVKMLQKEREEHNLKEQMSSSAKCPRCDSPSVVLGVCQSCKYFLKNSI